MGSPLMKTIIDFSKYKKIKISQLYPADGDLFCSFISISVKSDVIQCVCNDFLSDSRVTSTFYLWRDNKSLSTRFVDICLCKANVSRVVIKFACRYCCSTQHMYIILINTDWTRWYYRKETYVVGLETTLINPSPSKISLRQYWWQVWA